MNEGSSTRWTNVFLRMLLYIYVKEQMAIVILSLECCKHFASNVF